MRLWKSIDRKAEFTWSAPTGIGRTTQEGLPSIVEWPMSRGASHWSWTVSPLIWGYFLCSAVLSTGYTDLDKRLIKAAVFLI